MTTRGSQLEVRARSVGRQHRMGGSRPRTPRSQHVPRYLPLLLWQASFQYNTRRSGDSYADFYGTAATSSPELCHDKCTPYVAAAFASYVPRSSPTANDAECHCVGVLSTSSTLAQATASTLCRRQWCATEALNAPCHQRAHRSCIYASLCLPTRPPAVATVTYRYIPLRSDTHRYIFAHAATGRSPHSPPPHSPNSCITVPLVAARPLRPRSRGSNGRATMPLSSILGRWSATGWTQVVLSASSTHSQLKTGMPG